MAARVNLTDSLISATRESAAVRTGYIRRVDASSVEVEVGGSTFTASYLNSYNPPILGDLVAVVKQDATWLVLGSMAGTPDDLQMLPNGTFTLGSTGWTAVQITGAALPSGASISVVEDPFGVDAGNVAQFVNSSTTNNLHMAYYSAPMPCRAGDTFLLSGYASTVAFAPTGTTVIPPHNVQLFLSWHLNSTTVYPDPNAAIVKKSTMAMQLVDLRESPPYSFMSGAITVPAVAAITAMRVVLGSITANAPATNGGVRFDAISVRRL